VDPEATYLIIGDEHDLGMILAMLESFPAGAHGTVFLELPGHRDVPILLPDDMSLTVLPRGPQLEQCPAERLVTGHDPSADLRSEQHAPGHRARTALEAWADEWLIDGVLDPARHALWIGMVGLPVMDAACDGLLDRHVGVHLHRPGLGHCSHVSY
jgi:NADPH-dependent ferric siderophore reductase